MCSSIEYFGDALKGLLSSCIPYLQFKHTLFYFEDECSKFDSDSYFMVLIELVGCCSMHQTRFAHPRVSNNNDLEEDVLLDVNASFFVGDYAVGNLL
jgi:hypothetical protein